MVLQRISVCVKTTTFKRSQRLRSILIPGEKLKLPSWTLSQRDKPTLLERARKTKYRLNRAALAYLSRKTDIVRQESVAQLSHFPFYALFVLIAQLLLECISIHKPRASAMHMDASGHGRLS